MEWRYLLQGEKHKIISYSGHRNLLLAIKPQLLTHRNHVARIIYYIQVCDILQTLEKQW